MEEKNFYQWLEFLIYSLQLPQWPLEEKISRQQAIALIANFFNLDPNDPELAQKALSELQKIFIEEKPPPSIPPNLQEIVKEYENFLNSQEENLGENPSYWEFYRKISSEVLKRLKNPWLAKAVGIQTAKQIAEKVPPKTPLQKKEYQITLQSTINERLPSQIKLPEKEIKKITKKTYASAIKLTAVPPLPPTPPSSPVPSSPQPPISEEIPPSVAAKITSENQGVAFRPVFTVFHPPTTASAFKKIVFTPIVKPLQWAVKISPENIPEEIKKAVLEGLTSKDIQESIKTLQQAGLPSAHPKVDQLKNLQERLESFESTHRVLTFFFRHYYEFSKKTEKRQIQESQTKTWLPQLSPPPAWEQKKGWAWNLKEGLNRLGTSLKTHQWIPTPSGKKIIHFVFPDKIIRFFSGGKFQTLADFKTAAYQKFIQPALVWLAKTPFGTAMKKAASWLVVKTGLTKTTVVVGKKIAVKKGLKAFFSKALIWVGKKLGLNLAPVIGQVLAILSFAWDIFKLGFKAIKGFFRKIGSFFSEILPIKAKKTAEGVFDSAVSFVYKTVFFVGGILGGLTTISLPSFLPLVAVVLPIVLIAGSTHLNLQSTQNAFLTEEILTPEQNFYNLCYIEDIHQTDLITQENKEIFIARNKAAYPNSLIEEKIDQVISEAISIGFNPALAVAIWGEETHFSDYTVSVPGNDFGCGVFCSSGKPTNFDESLACFVAKKDKCNNACLSKQIFSEFMECYGPSAQNPNFIHNVLLFYQQLVPTGPGTIVCPGGTTGEFASRLIFYLKACYGNIINKLTYTDNGQCLINQGIPSQSVSHITWSVNQFSALQCVGFAKAVEAGTGAENLGFVTGAYGDAINYYRPLTGYIQIPKEEENVIAGDLAFFSGTSSSSAGHVGVVVEVAPDMSWFRMAQAIGYDNNNPWGKINESERIPITYNSLVGFLRKTY